MLYRWISALMVSLLVCAGTACDGADDDDTATDDDDTGDDDTAADDDTSETWGQESLDMITEMVGTYTGDFEMYGLDGGDQAITVMTWTDTAVATNPRIEGDRAVVDVHEEMVVDQSTTYEMDWLEGVLIEADGSAGSRFIDMNGIVTIQTEVEPGHFEYQQDLDEYDHYYWDNITPVNLVSGYHVMNKIVTDVQGVETHEITRTTYVDYEDQGGTIISVEFVSLQGTHEKSN